MKKLRLWFAVSAVGVLLAAGASYGQPKDPNTLDAPPRGVDATRSGQVLAFRAVEPQPGITPKAFEEFAGDRYAPTWRK